MNPTSNNHIAALFAVYREASQGLADLEGGAARLSLPAPSASMPSPRAKTVRGLARAARRLDARYQAWNARLLDAERHLEEPTPQTLEARKVGERSHRWYEATKPLYLALGVERRHEATTELYKRAIIEAPQNEHARRFLVSRGMHVRGEAA